MNREASGDKYRRRKRNDESYRKSPKERGKSHRAIWNKMDFYVATKGVISEGYVGEPIYSSHTISDRIDVPLSMWGKP